MDLFTSLTKRRSERGRVWQGGRGRLGLFPGGHRVCSMMLDIVPSPPNDSADRLSVRSSLSLSRAHAIANVARNVINTTCKRARMSTHTHTHTHTYARVYLRENKKRSTGGDRARPGAHPYSKTLTHRATATTIGRPSEMPFDY